MNINKTDLKDYNYDLPHERIAQYPASERDLSQLLVYKNDKISKDRFRNIISHIPADSLLVFNNTRVIRARILFRKETGAMIEVLCLEPLSPVDYELSFGSVDPVEWKCIVGNLKKWKSGKISTPFQAGDKNGVLTATMQGEEGDAWRIRFDWSLPDISFAEVIEMTGLLPLPPYLEREADADDLKRYQTVYSRIRGSVAAPTAGLHFTEAILENLRASGTATTEITLHVGAGTFKPIKSKTISEHEMHCEHFNIKRETIELLKKYHGSIIPVGTTSVRTLESLYWIGVKIKNNPELRSDITVDQWEAYKNDSDLAPVESMEIIINFMKASRLDVLQASTSIIIVPGYKFRMISGIVTNFHQPMSTLLLLISAWVGEKWKEIYRYAMDNDFRFLSYGDCSLLLRDTNNTSV